MIYVQPSVARATLAAMSEFFLVAHQDPPPLPDVTDSRSDTPLGITVL
jgi:hypothetical protein